VTKVKPGTGIGAKWIASLVVALTLSACTANQPATLSQISVENVTAQITSHPLYPVTDAFSFSTAATTYPANSGSHTIPVGNYLLLNVLNLLPEESAGIRLTNFNSKCQPGRVFLPNVICTTSYSLTFSRSGNSRTIEGKVATDVGSQYVKDDQLLLGVAAYRDYGDGTIVGQVKRTLDEVVGDIKRQL